MPRSRLRGDDRPLNRFRAVEDVVAPSVENVMTTTTITKEGSVEIPSELRERFGLHEGSVLVAEAGEEGILLRPTELPEVEIYKPERIAEFLLGNAIDEDDYERALEEVRGLGLDPAQILHDRPRG